MSKRGFMIGGVIAVPVLVLGGVIAVRSWLPSLVRDRVVHALEQRTGLTAHVGDVRVGASSIVLIDVVAGDDKGIEPAVLAADRVTVHLSPLRMLTEGMAAIASVQVDHVRVEARRDHHGFDAWRARLVNLERPMDQKAGSARSRPELRVDHMSLLASDDHGQLLEAQAEHVSFAGDVLTAQFEQVRVGSAPGTSLMLKDVEINVARVDGVFGLREMHIGHAALGLAGAEGPSLRARASRWVAADGSPTTADVTATTVSPHAALATTVMERLSEGSLITVEQATVADGGHMILRDLKARVQMTQVDELLLEGTGHTTADGRVQWKLRVWPKLLRGEGNVDLDKLPFSLLSAFLPQLPWHDVGKSTVDAELVLQGDGASRIGWSGRMALRDVALYSARIAPEAVELPSVALSGRGYFFPSDRRLEIAEGRIGLAAASAEIVGAIENASDHYVVDVNATLPRTACEDVLSSIPRALLGDIAAFHLAGSASAHVRLKADSRALAGTELELAVDDGCDFVEVPALADLRRFTGPFMHYAVEPDETVFEMETGPGTEHWTSLEEVSPLFVHAVLAHEDTQFFTHHGFSPTHIRGALVRNLEAGRYVLGASTISMQLVKNLLLRREKTLARKAQEVVLTWWIERMLDKRDILELYLNVIEYGPGIYGIRNAARYYFSREPSELSPAESVFLSTILPNPKSYHSFFEQNALSANWIERMRSQIQRMQARGWYAPETAAYGLKELTAFKFFPEGSVRMPSPTPMPDKTSLLPYQPGASLSNGLPTMDQLNFATIDGGE